MKKEQYQKIIWKMIAAAASVVAFLLYSIGTFAIGNNVAPMQEAGDDVITISMPVVSESDTSVFDFILDPQELLYSTDAVRYGGGTVEKGAALLFHNKEGEYDFSEYSDWLTVTNQGTVPVLVTITAQISGLEEIRLVEDADFSEDTDPAIYLAIVDNRGTVQPLSADGQAAICLELDMDYDTYSFGLTGACNANAQWQDISVYPTIKVTWYVEPIMPEEEDIFIEEDMSIEEDLINVEDDIVEDGDEIISDDIQDDDISVDNSDGDNEEGSANNNEESDDTAADGFDVDNNDINSDVSPDYDDSQSIDNEYEYSQNMTEEETEEKSMDNF